MKKTTLIGAVAGKATCLFLLCFVVGTNIFAQKKLFINEISGNEKWLEIYNGESEDVTLTGYKIQKIDEKGATADWAIPAGTVISGNGFLSWTQDKENTDGSTFTWGISASKDVGFKIFNDEGIELDFFDVKSDLYTGADETVGRKTDGATELVIFIHNGTKGTSNNDGTQKTYSGEDPKKIFVNEISGNEKWLEIYNGESEDVTLTGYKIQKIDEKGATADWTIPAGTVISGNGFLSWTQDKDNTDGSTFTWGISASKDVGFKIFNDEGIELDFFDVKSDLYTGADETVGRKTDGATELVIFIHNGTKDASNNDGTQKIFSGEDPKRIFVNEINGNEKWLEIYNDEDEDVVLTGYKIQKIDESGKIDETFSIPEGTEIKSKGFLTWTQDANCTDGSTFKKGISAKKDVGFKIFDNENNQLDYFDVQMSAGLNSEGEYSVGRETDGAEKLVLFLNQGTKGASNNTGISATGLKDAKISALFGYIESGILYVSDNVTSITLYNTSGVRLLSRTIEANRSVDIGHFYPSTYILELSDGNEVKIDKIILKK